MRKLLPIIALSSCLIVSQNSIGQITIDQTKFTGTYTTYDAVRVVNGSAGIPAAANGAFGMMGFDGVSYSGTDSVMYMPAPTGYTFQWFKTDTISSPYLFMSSRGYYTIGSGGYMQNVFRLDRRGYTLYGGVIGAGTGDSIIFNQQLDTLSAPLNIIQFPATNASKWTSSYTTKVNYTVKAPGLFIPNSDGYNIRHETETDSVTGYGDVYIKRDDGGTSNVVQVLQVKVMHTRVDSFYLNGLPAPPSLMQPPFLQQGLTKNTYQYRYYRLNEITPFVEVTYADAGYSAVSSARVHTQRTQPAGSVAQIVDRNGIAVYPNPAKSHVIFVNLPSSVNDWSYKLTNMSGQVVSGGVITKGQSVAQVYLPTVTAGSYSFELTDGNIKTVKLLQIALSN